MSLNIFLFIFSINIKIDIKFSNYFIINKLKRLNTATNNIIRIIIKSFNISYFFIIINIKFIIKNFNIINILFRYINSRCKYNNCIKYISIN